MELRLTGHTALLHPNMITLSRSEILFNTDVMLSKFIKPLSLFCEHDSQTVINSFPAEALHRGPGDVAFRLDREERLVAGSGSAGPGTYSCTARPESR